MSIAVHPLARGLIFDLDGTLADTMSMHLKSWNLLGAEFGVTITDQMILDRSGTPTFEVALDLNRTFGWSLDPHKVQAAKNRHYNRIKKEEGPIRAIAKIKDIVLQYYGQLPMAVGTGSIPENALEALSHIGLDTHFITLVTARDVVRPKPNPEVFLRCAAAMQIEPRYCQVYEDGEMGFLAARNAQMILTDIEKEITTTPPY